MEFRIADTFTDSLARLTGDEQRAVKTTAFDLQMNPASPGLSFHRLERVRDARVLLTTFSDTLANALRDKLARLISNEPMIGERLEVHAIDRLAARLHQARRASATLVTPEGIAELLVVAAAGQDQQPFSTRFLQAEWHEVVDAWQLESWEAYRDVRRLGRKTRLPEQPVLCR